MNLIPYTKQWIEQDDIDAVVSTLKSECLTQGPAVKQFEKAICEYTGATYCVAVASGTAALHIAVAALDLPSGSEGITSPITFMATSNSMLYCGVKPVFADICAKTYNITAENIEKKITHNTRLIAPVHLAGQPCDMAAINKIAKEISAYVIEDAAHAIGSNYADGTKVGCCKYSDMTIFSFHPAKTITAGEGGAVTTNSPELYEKLCMLRSHGITSNPQKMTQCPRPYFHEMQQLGFNYRLSDIHAALGVSQLKKLDRFKAERRRIVGIYNEKLTGIENLFLPFEPDKADSCFHLYIVRINFKALGKSRGVIMEQLISRGILTQVHFTPVPTQPYYRGKLGYLCNDLPNAMAYYEQCLSLPLFPAMTDEEIDKVINVVKDVIR